MSLGKYMKGRHIHLSFLPLKCPMRPTMKSMYVLKVTVSRGCGGSIVEYQDFVVISLSLSNVRNYTPPPSINNSIKVKVKDCLCIELEYNKSKYHLKDVIGKVNFLLVRMKIKEYGSGDQA